MFQEEQCSCSCNGIIIKPDGINELDPCLYEVEESYANVSVEISRCIRCGKVNISWFRQDNTEKIQ